MSSNLDNEEIDDVDIEEIQGTKAESLDSSMNIVYEDIFYGDGVLEDDNINIGSMVAINCDPVESESECDFEVIVPDMLDPLVEVPTNLENNPEDSNKPSNKWPQLEILPGGVIKNADLFNTKTEEVQKSSEMMYACAKCPQQFEHLYCLVRHVKWHEMQEKSVMKVKEGKLNNWQKEMVSLKRQRSEMEKSYKKQKLKVLSRIATALGNIDTISRFSKG